ncbi:carboxypeptidase-like regulatory domain-containing protein, partial [Bacteroides heparinolyticus]
MLRNLKLGGVILSLWCGGVQSSFAANAAGYEVVQQNGTCTGIVKDSTGETIIGASVLVKGTSNGTITGIDGDFSLRNVPQGSIIQISFVGYQTQEVKWTGTPLNIILKDD